MLQTIVPLYMIEIEMKRENMGEEEAGGGLSQDNREIFFLFLLLLFFLSFAEHYRKTDEDEDGVERKTSLISSHIISDVPFLTRVMRNCDYSNLVYHA